MEGGTTLIETVQLVHPQIKAISPTLKVEQVW